MYEGRLGDRTAKMNNSIEKKSRFYHTFASLRSTNFSPVYPLMKCSTSTSSEAAL
jgi:hypothetical protein